MGGYLVSIADADENALVRSLADSECGNVNAMIGLSDFASEGTFQWESGEPVAYTNWASGQPNDFGNEDGVQMLDSGQWNDNSGGGSCIVCEAAPVLNSAACTYSLEACSDGNSCTYDSCNASTGACSTTTPASDCCVTDNGKGCGNSTCQSCVCAVDAFCCTTSWDIYCVSCANGGTGFQKSCVKGDCVDECGCDALLTCGSN